jgi:hypothetical protein
MLNYNLLGCNLLGYIRNVAEPNGKATGATTSMKKLPPKLETPKEDAAFEAELARRLSIHFLHLAGRTLSEHLWQIPDLKTRTTVTEVIGQIQTLERRLADLAPKS